MPTQHIHRLFIVAPVGIKSSALNTWFRTNIDLTGTDWLSVPLSADGDDPATHLACDVALTEPHIKALFRWFKTVTGASFPDNWDERTRAQKVSWIRDTAIPWLWDNYEVGLLHTNNDGDWSEHTVDTRLQQLELQRITEIPS